MMSSSSALPQNDTFSARREEDRALRSYEEALERLAAMPDTPEDAPERRRLRGELESTGAELGKLRRSRASASTRTSAPKAVTGELLVGARTTGIDVEVKRRMAYVPTGIVHLLGAPSPLGSARPIVTVVVRQGGESPAGTPSPGPSGPTRPPGPSGPTRRLRVEAVVEGYSAREVHVRETAASEVQFDLMPTFFLDRLRTVTETTRAALHVQVSQLSGKGSAGDVLEIEQTIPIWLLARNAACLSMIDPATGKMEDYSYALGAWVTPNEPDVLELLSTAAAEKRGFFGRQGRTDADLAAQVEQIYVALGEGGWKYVDFIATTPEVDGSFYQRVRLPRESLKLRGGNCLDGVLLFASLLEAASLEPALVLMKKHAVVAWRRADSADGKGEWAFLDTTSLGQDDFTTALEQGDRHARREAHKQRLSGSETPEYFRICPISEVRLRGVLPLE